ncbi:DUF6630 family protein [Nocardia goodfellowii]|uniref:DUF6630 domain-containing protein n=1 Tax=Nocardia goodfellowii TaxID=882446 RepID=A0ABS4QMT4_9NOCA|nr:hypothetical protein [Nocardia goodfellowii]MBP2193015.1 hypothetical protein [Nocardia goodfellowii]
MSEHSRQQRSPLPCSAEYALISTAVLLAPDENWASHLVQVVTDALNDPDEFKRRHRNWLDERPCTPVELAREALIVSLGGGMWGMEAYLALCDHSDGAVDISERLNRVSRNWKMSLDLDPTSLGFTQPDQLDGETYLREVAGQCRAMGLDLFRLRRGDSYELGFVRTGRCGLLLADAAAAGFTYEADRIFEIVEPR